jgi:hypothetical protein
MYNVLQRAASSGAEVRLGLSTVVLHLADYAAAPSPVANQVKRPLCLSFVAQCHSVSVCVLNRTSPLCLSVCCVCVCVCVCVLYKRLCAASTTLPFSISISRSRSRSLSHSLSLPPSILHPYPYHPPCVGDMTLFPRIFTILSLTDGIVYSMFHQDYANDCFSIFPYRKYSCINSSLRSSKF